LVFVLSNHAQERAVQRGIREQWIQETILNPQQTEIDPVNSTALRAWRKIPERNNSILRKEEPQNKLSILISLFHQMKKHCLENFL
jgi:hypothetical protein